MEKILKAFASGNSVVIPLKSFGITTGRRCHEGNRVIIEEAS